MAEENSTQVTQPTQPTQPQVAMKPKWLIDTEKLEELKKQGQFAQVAWKSNNEVDCAPIGLTAEMDHSEYPISIERPTGYWAPKMDWSGSPHWLETANIQQGQEIEEMKKQISELAETTKTVTNNQTTESAKNTQASQLMMMLTKQLGTVVTKVDALDTKIDNLAKPTEPTKPTKPTTPTETEGGKN